MRLSASHDMSLIQMQRLDDQGYGKKRRPLWLVWVGEQFLELTDIWTQYARRFERRKCVGFPRLFHFAVGVDHWYRFAKQRLHWILPSLSTAKQCERWSDLMPLMTWQLWLAKDLVEEHHLPWQSRRINLTPARVAQSLLSLLAVIGTPTTSPKPRGKSPGWKQGEKRRKRKTYPIAKKSHRCGQALSRAKKSKKQVT